VYRTQETQEPWLSRSLSHDRQVSYLDSGSRTASRCRLARHYIFKETPTQGGTLHIARPPKTKHDDALAKPSPSDPRAERPETFPKNVASCRINHPSVDDTFLRRASWRWHPRRCAAGALTAERSAASGRRATSPPARRAAGSSLS
jgi:hypothetical protein